MRFSNPKSLFFNFDSQTLILTSCDSEAFSTVFPVIFKPSLVLSLKPSLCSPDFNVSDDDSRLSTLFYSLTGEKRGGGAAYHGRGDNEDSRYQKDLIFVQL
ncbi:hypothetical protein QL285_083310 [Trifolium repens]|nr:hypothetical protein QL285_083310 [Trifolium repens]